MARPVRPETGTTHRMSEASQPGNQNGTLFADPIKASSPKSTASTGRTEDCSRPTPIHQISLAMREPSTEDIRRAESIGIVRPNADIGRERLNVAYRREAVIADRAVGRFSGGAVIRLSNLCRASADFHSSGNLPPLTRRYSRLARGFASREFDDLRGDLLLPHQALTRL